VSTRLLAANVALPPWGMVRRVERFDVHDPKVCRGEFCVIHNPSPHKMRHWPKVYRLDLPGCPVERTCPHGVGHTDPDSVAYMRRVGYFVPPHGCDGCCHDA